MLGAFSLLTSWLFFLAGSVWRVLARRPRRRTHIDRSQVRSIALIRLDEMGDFALFSSILGPLRRAFPDAHITLILCQWIVPLAQLCPYVDEVVPFPSSGPKWRQYLLGPFRALRVARSFRRRFDLVINPRFDRDIRGAGFLANFTLAPWVLGYPSSTEQFKSVVNRGYDRFYTHLIPAPVAAMHDVERSRAILEYLGIPHHDAAPELWISDEDRRQADRLLRQEGWHPGDTLICLGIAANHPRRRWPMESFRQIAGQLISDSRFLIVGSPQDRETAELLRPFLGSRLIDLAGRAPLRVSAAALGQCSLYVGNDSGPMHLAAAHGMPVVEISCHPRDGAAGHFQSPARFSPLTDQSIVLAPETALSPCTEACLAEQAHCITQISVEQVLDVVHLVRQPLGCHQRYE